LTEFDAMLANHLTTSCIGFPYILLHAGHYGIKPVQLIKCSKGTTERDWYCRML